MEPLIPGLTNEEVKKLVWDLYYSKRYMSTELHDGSLWFPIGVKSEEMDILRKIQEPQE